MKTTERFSLIGTGNIATWLAHRIHTLGGMIVDVYSRSLDKAMALANTVNARPVDDLRALNSCSDVYLFAIADDAYEAVVDAVPFVMPYAVHTAGSVPIAIFNGKATRFGTIYPYQTISKSMNYDAIKVPLCVEGNSPETERMLLDIARQWSDIVYPISGVQREQLHLAAVFSCNFVNALYDTGFSLLQEKGIDPELLYPLWEHTLTKMQTMTPKEAQTGPAIRGDQKTIAKHLEMIGDDKFAEVYRLMTEIIGRMRNSNTDLMDKRVRSNAVT
jgi:predicted short-subunit dehydrogenase-like oxidoreductase (DUF2520 family)